jgi:hypothetical protein
MNYVFAEVISVTDAPDGPTVDEIQLYDAYLKIGDSPLREWPDLRREAY